MADKKLAKGTEVVANVDGGEWDGRVVREYVEDNVPMVEIESNEPFWDGEYAIDAAREDVREV